MVTLQCRSRAEAQTRPHIPTAAEIGLRPLIDPNEPPQTSLKPLLHSFLHTLLLLIDVLTGSARPPHELAEKGWGHEGDQVTHPTNLAGADNPVHPAHVESRCYDHGDCQHTPRSTGRGDSGVAYGKAGRDETSSDRGSQEVSSMVQGAAPS